MNARLPPCTAPGPLARLPAWLRRWLPRRRRRWLIALHVGPVQDFIGAARRTRDLWFGSHVLSEVAKAAARSLNERQASLIFPGIPDGVTAEAFLAAESPYTLSNHILAVLDTSSPEKALEDARKDARAHWLQLAEHAFKMAQAHCYRRDGKRVSPLRPTVWNRQVEDALEFYHGWVPLAGDADEIHAVRRVERLMAARRLTRNFAGAQGNAGWDKSSLDGRGETVLADDRHSPGGVSLPDGVRLRLGLGRGEQLDCAGLMKRLCPSAFSETSIAEQFTPVARVAAQPWVEEVLARIKEDEPAARAWNVLLDCHETLLAANLGLASRVTGNRDGGASIYAGFPYDAEMLHAFRLPPQEKRLATLLANEKVWLTLQEKDCEDKARQARDSLGEIARSLRELAKVAGRPCAYVALLQADGDGLGKLLGDEDLDLKCRASISSDLAGFAARVPEIVRLHGGHCIYAGADDLLALLPVEHAFDCANHLRQEFTRASNDWHAPASLSVGIGISHILEPLGVQRRVALEAIKMAKGREERVLKERKNAVGVVLNLRGGGDIRWRARWNQAPDPITRLGAWIEAFRQDRLPGGLAYDLRVAARRFAWAAEGNDAPAIRGELLRLLGKKRAQGGAEQLADPAIELAMQSLAIHGNALNGLADELLLARWVAREAAPPTGG